MAGVTEYACRVHILRPASHHDVMQKRVDPVDDLLTHILHEVLPCRQYIGTHHINVMIPAPPGKQEVQLEALLQVLSLDVSHVPGLPKLFYHLPEASLHAPLPVAEDTLDARVLHDIKELMEVVRRNLACRCQHVLLLLLVRGHVLAHGPQQMGTLMSLKAVQDPPHLRRHLSHRRLRWDINLCPVWDADRVCACPAGHGVT